MAYQPSDSRGIGDFVLQQPSVRFWRWEETDYYPNGTTVANGEADADASLVGAAVEGSEKRVTPSSSAGGRQNKKASTTRTTEKATATKKKKKTKTKTKKSKKTMKRTADGL